MRKSSELNSDVNCQPDRQPPEVEVTERESTRNLLGNFEHTKESNTAENRNSQWWHNVGMAEHHFDYTSEYNKTIETIEQRYEIPLKS